MKQNKLTYQQQEEQLAATQQQAQGAQEFATVEEMLRHDAVHTPVPPTIADRLRISLEQLPPRPTSWWRRLFAK